MEQINNIFSSLDAELTLWIAGIVALIFIFLVIFDSVKKARKRARVERRIRAVKPLPSRLSQVREGYRAIKEEAKKRQRRNAYMRKVNKPKR